jgi:fluoroacetyl-CoA thioesterase
MRVPGSAVPCTDSGIRPHRAVQGIIPVVDSTAEIEFQVTTADTAGALMSGDLPVLGTPRLVAWLEAATCAAAGPRLEVGQTTVGTRIAIEHRAPSAVGAAVLAAAELTTVDGRTLTFDVRATDTASGELLADGTITRVVVDEQRFMARLGTGR